MLPLGFLEEFERTLEGHEGASCGKSMKINNINNNRDMVRFNVNVTVNVTTKWMQKLQL